MSHCRLLVLCHSWVPVEFVYAGAEGAAETMSHWRTCPYALASSRVKTAANPTVVDRKYTFLIGIEYCFLN